MKKARKVFEDVLCFITVVISIEAILLVLLYN